MFGMHFAYNFKRSNKTTNEYFVLNKYTVSKIFVPFSSKLHKCIKHIEYFFEIDILLCFICNCINGCTYFNKICTRILI